MAWSWEDFSLVLLTAGWISAGAGMEWFHLYALSVMLVVLSIGFRRGLSVSLSRAAGVCAFLLGLLRFRVWAGGTVVTGIVLLAGASILAGIFGSRESRARDRLARSFWQTLEVLARALETRDPYTEGHSQRAVRYAMALANALQLSDEECEALEQAAMLHDVGKIGVPDAVLRKTGPLTAEETRQMAQHPVLGSDILQGIAFLEEAAPMVRHHHEHFDGSGYPDSLAGSAIPVGARILAVADALDALTTDRTYHKAIGRGEAIREIEKGSGRTFDPDVVQALRWADLDAPARSFGPKKH